MKRTVSAAIVVACLWGGGRLGAHPEFQMFAQQNSGRIVNCAMCHAHADGPEGVKPGQLGSLTDEEQFRLAEARAAFEPGVDVSSPILNEFGNHLVAALGKKSILEARLKPDRLAELLGTGSDIDDDGIPDATEYLEGTHPLVAGHGDPWRLFTAGLARESFHIAMLFLATVAGLYGLNHLLRWFAQLTESLAAEANDEGSSR